jgi:hypothetical protein
MRSERELIGAIDFSSGRSDRRICIAIVANDFAGLCRVVEELLMQCCRRFACVRPVIPFHLQSFASLYRRLGIVGYNGDSASCERSGGYRIDCKNFPNPSHGFSFRSVERFYFAAKHRTARYDRELHAGNT